MSVLSRDNFIIASSSEKVVLAHLHGRQRVINWVVHSGPVYKKSLPHFVVELSNYNTPLTKVDTLVGLAPGQFYYDIKNKVVYLHMPGSIDPNVSSEMIVTYRFFLSNIPISGLAWDLGDTSEHVFYEPRIIRNPGYDHQVGFEQDLIALVGSGTLRLENNDAAFDAIFDSVIFENQICEIYSWNRHMLPSSAQIIFRGRVQNKKYNPDAVWFNIKDEINNLKQHIPQTAYSDADAVATDVKGRYKRWVYGRVDGLKLQSIDQIAEGYPISGTVTGSAFNATIFGISTQFLTECSPGDKIIIDTQEFDILSIESDTQLTLDDTPEFGFVARQALLVPEIPVTSKNREFLVSEHASARLTKTVEEIIRLNRVRLNNTTGLSVGDFVEFTTGERLEIKEIPPGNIIVLRQNLILIPAISSSVTRQPVQTVYVNGKDIPPELFTITNVGAPTNLTSVTLSAQTEFTLSTRKSLGASANFQAGKRYVLATTSVPLGDVLSPRDYIKPKPTNYTTYYEILSVGQGYPTSGTVSGSSTSNLITGSGTSFTTEYAVNDTIVISGEEFTVSQILSNTSIQLGSTPSFEFNGIIPRKEDDTSIELRQTFVGAPITTSVSYRSPEYIGDNTTISADVLGRTVDGEPDSAWITTAADAVKDILASINITNINTASFTTASLDNTATVSLMIPSTPTGQQETVKSVIDKLNQSVHGALTLDSDLRVNYRILNPQLALDNLIEITDNQVISWSIESTNGKTYGNMLVRYRHSDVDRSTLDRGSGVKTYESSFVQTYIGTNQGKELDLYLYEPVSAEIALHRSLYYNSLGRSDINITSDLRLEALEIGDQVVINFRRLYKRFGGLDNRKVCMVVGKRVNGEQIFFTLTDFGNIYNRSSIITPNDAPEWTLASDLEKLKYGYITDANGIVNNEENTTNIHLIS